MKPSIIRLRALEKQLYAYLYAMTVIDFDAETVAPEGSADGRAEATEVHIQPKGERGGSLRILRGAFYFFGF